MAPQNGDLLPPILVLKSTLPSRQGEGLFEGSVTFKQQGLGSISKIAGIKRDLVHIVVGQKYCPISCSRFKRRIGYDVTGFQATCF